MLINIVARLESRTMSGDSLRLVQCRACEDITAMRFGGDGRGTASAEHGPQSRFRARMPQTQQYSSRFCSVSRRSRKAAASHPRSDSPTDLKTGRPWHSHNVRALLSHGLNFSMWTSLHVHKMEHAPNERLYARYDAFNIAMKCHSLLAKFLRSIDHIAQNPTRR